LRRTAVWAVGRSGDLKDANLLINALNDFNVDVLSEAYNSLSYLSRKIDGVGIDSNPYAELDEFPTQEQRNAAMAAWKKEAIKRWSAWYLRVRPYAERNDIFELGLKSKRK
jgi:HEAT repeat protein